MRPIVAELWPELLRVAAHVAAGAFGQRSLSADPLVCQNVEGHFVVELQGQVKELEERICSCATPEQLELYAVVIAVLLVINLIAVLGACCVTRRIARASQAAGAVRSWPVRHVAGRGRIEYA